MNRLLIIIYIVFHSLNSFAQYPDIDVNKDYFKSYLTDTRDLAISPFRWNNNQWYTVAAVGAGTFTLFLLDEEIQKFMSTKVVWGENASKYIFEPIGSGRYTFPIMGGLYIYGAIAKENRPKAAALNGVKAWLLSVGTVLVIKHITHRHRPFQDEPPNAHIWEGPLGGTEYDAFPSGHTVSAWSVATVIASTYSDKLWVQIASYSLATGAGLSRLKDNKHWASDVFVGAVIGFAVGKMVHNNYMKGTNLSLSPATVPGGMGLSLTYNLK